jgi:hypothetical protein
VHAPGVAERVLVPGVQLRQSFDAPLAVEQLTQEEWQVFFLHLLYVASHNWPAGQVHVGGDPVGADPLLHVLQSAEAPVSFG